MMRRTNILAVLWDYCIKYNAELRNLTVTNYVDLLDRTPFEKAIWYTPDIPELVEFEWLQWVWYNDPVAQGQIQLVR